MMAMAFIISSKASLYLNYDNALLFSLNLNWPLSLCFFFLIKKVKNKIKNVFWFLLL
jgi:hypothetical protein